MQFSICIASLGRRHAQLQELLNVLMPQVNRYQSIEVVVCRNNGELTIGQYRQALLEAAKGKYICFVDDDDLLPAYYCEEIMSALNNNPDYVGFKVKLTNNEIERQPVYHSIRYADWSQDDLGYYRGVTHLNPIKRSIALKGSFTEANGSGEDEMWAKQIRPLVKTEEYIDEYMYFYRHDTEDSHFGGSKVVSKKDYPLPKIRSKHLRYLEAI